MFFRPVSRIAPFASLVFLGVQTAARRSPAAPSLPRRSACAGSSRPPPSISSRRHRTSSTSCSTSSSRTCSTTSFSRIARRSIASSAGFSISPITRARSRRRRSACRRCWRARSTGTRSRRRSSFAKRSSSRPIFEKVSQRGIRRRRDVDRPDRFIRAVDGSRSGAELEGRALPDSQALSSAGKTIARSRRGSSLELSLFRHVPHAAKAFSVERPDTFYRPIWMDRTESPAQVRRHEASNSVAFLEQFIGLMTRGARSARLQAAARRRAPPPDRRRSRMPLHRPHGHVAGELHRAIAVRDQARRRRCSIARARSASTTAASSSCRPITAPICRRSGSAEGAKACRSFPGLRPCGCRRLPPRQRR